MISLTLTYPPSANRLWRNIKGKTLKSAEYRSWLDLNAGLHIASRFKTITGPYRMTLLAHAPDKRRRDLGNLEKPVSDLLQHIGAISDDCNAREILLAWVETPGAGVSITLEPVEV